MPLPTTTHTEFCVRYTWQGDLYTTHPYKTLAEAHAARIELRAKGFNGTYVHPVRIFDIKGEK